MKKITCTLPNASEEISGIPFVAGDGCVVADGVDDAVAALFEGIPGYTIEDGKPAVDPKAAKAAAKAAKIAADEAEAEAAAAAAAEAAAEAEATAKAAANTTTEEKK